MIKLDPILHERLSTLIITMGCVLWGYEVQARGKQSLLRLYIDKPSGVTIDDCTAISRQVNAMMNVEESLAGQYLLEVSSPGIDRPLYELAQYNHANGKRIKIKLHIPHGDRRHYQGILQAVEGETLRLLLDDTKEEVAFTFNEIEKGQLIGSVDIITR